MLSRPSPATDRTRESGQHPSSLGQLGHLAFHQATGNAHPRGQDPCGKCMYRCCQPGVESLLPAVSGVLPVMVPIADEPLSGTFALGRRLVSDDLEDRLL